MPQRIIPPVKLYFPDQDVERIKQEVDSILRSGMLTLGSRTRDFEARFARLIDVEHAVAVSSGTSALEIALRAIGLKSGDEVLVPTNTFTATAAAVIFSGGKPVFTDIDPESLCLDCENVRKFITPKTKGVITVHIAGVICPEIEEIQRLCRDLNLFLVEDAAHAQGSRMKGRSAGSFGDLGCFSFYPTKVITTAEGGMVTTRSTSLAEKAVVLRDQGKDSFYGNNIVELGYNWRMNEISAAIGLTQLKRLEEIIQMRTVIARSYDQHLSKLGGIRPQRIPSHITSNYYKYVVFLDPDIDRDTFKKKLAERGVHCGGELYWPPCHLQPVYQRLFGTKKGDFPNSEDATRRMVCLPIFAGMTSEDVDYVISMVGQVLSSI